MGLRVFLTAVVAIAMGLLPAERVEADAGDFVGGAIVGGLLGAAIANDQAKRRATTQRRTTQKKVYRSSIPSTQKGRDSQRALNYFGYNAGRVDGQIGPGTRRAVERYQAAWGFPVNGRNFKNNQYNILMEAYYWAINGGQAQTGLSGQPLLLHYQQMRREARKMARLQQQPQTAPVAAQVIAPQVVPQVVAPQVVAPAATAPLIPAQPAAPAPAVPAIGTVVAASQAPADTAMPNFFGGSSGVSLANSCNAVMLQTSSNGGYTTLASMNDPEFTLSEQFCLARTYAMARGEELMQKITGLNSDQIKVQCNAYAERMRAQVDMVSTSPQAQVEAAARDFALGTGMAPADLAATSRVCLAVGYGQDDMRMSVGAALMLVALGEPAYGELLGHHLREGFGTTTRADLAREWYTSSLTALEAGSQPVFMPGQTDRVQLLKAAAFPAPATAGAVVPAGQSADALPTFSISD